MRSPNGKALLDGRRGAVKFAEEDSNVANGLVTCLLREV